MLMATKELAVEDTQRHQKEV